MEASKAASVESKPWSSFQTLVVTKSSSRGTSVLRDAPADAPSLP